MKRNMKLRFTTAFFTLLLAGCLFAGCGGEEEKISDENYYTGEPPVYGNGGREYELAGTWLHSDGTIELYFDGIDFVQFSTPDGDGPGGSIAANCNYTYDGETLTIYHFESDTSWYAFEGYIDSDGDIVIDLWDFGGWYAFQEGIEGWDYSGGEEYSDDWDYGDEEEYYESDDMWISAGPPLGFEPIDATTNIASAIEIEAEYFLPNDNWGNTVHVLVVENLSGMDLDLAVYSNGYDEDGNVLDSYDESIFGLGGGCKAVITGSFDTYDTVAYADVSMSVSMSSEYESFLHNLSYMIDTPLDGAYITVANNGDEAYELVYGYLLYFNGGELVGIGMDFYTDENDMIQPGAVIEEHNSFFDEFDDVELYLVGRKHVN